MDAPILDSPIVDNGSSPTPGDSQVAPTVPKGTDTQQNSTTTQVENGATPTSTGQPGNSEYETARQLKQLAKQMRLMQQAFERSSQQNIPQAPPQPGNGKPSVTQDELLKDPLNTILRIMDERDQKLKGEIPKTFEQYNQQATKERLMQEGGKIAYTNEFVKRDPEGKERMQEIFNEEDENGDSLDKYSLINPVHAAKLALAIYKERFGSGQRKAAAPSKAQMTSTATAVSPGSSVNNVQDEAAQLLREYNNDQSLMNDPTFMAKLKAVNNKARQESFQRTS